MNILIRAMGLGIILGMLVACGGESTQSVTLPSPDELATPEETAEPSPEVEEIVEPTKIPTFTPTTEPTPTLPPSQGTVIELINDVVAHPIPEGEWETAVLNMSLYEGGEVWAKESSTALVELVIEILRVAPNTIFTLLQPDDKTTTLNLQEGQVWLNIEGLSPGETFQVETSTAIASVEGTRFSVRIDQEGQTIVSSQVHTITVSNPMGFVSVGEGYQTKAISNKPPTDPEPMSTEERLLWNMASGSDLDINIPIVGDPRMVSLTGESGEPDMSFDGSHVTFYTYDPSISEYSHSALLGVDVSGHYSMYSDSSLHEVSFNPAGDGMAYVKHSQICISSEDGSGESCFGNQADFRWPIWSPDGNQLVYGVGNTLMVSQLDGSDAYQITPSTSGINQRSTWSFDGTKIAYVNSPFFKSIGDVWVVNSDGSDPLKIFTGIQWSYFGKLAWSPDGEWFAFPADDGIWLVSSDGSNSHQLTSTVGWEYHDVTWSPTSTGWPLFFGYEDTSTGEEGTMFITSPGSDPQPFPNATWGPVWSADGCWGSFGYVAQDNGVYQSMIYTFQIESVLWP